MLNEQQLQRYEEVLGWTIEQRREVRAALHHVFGTMLPSEEIEDVDGDETEVGAIDSPDPVEPRQVPTVCPLVQLYASTLGSDLDEVHLGLIWNNNPASSIQCVFGTENKDLVERRIRMMIGFIKNCASRISGAIPAKETVERGSNAAALSGSGILAAGAALLALVRDDQIVIPKALVLEASNTAKRLDTIVSLRGYESDTDLSDLLGELRRGSMWLLFEMSVMK